MPSEPHENHRQQNHELQVSAALGKSSLDSATERDPLIVGKFTMKMMMLLVESYGTRKHTFIMCNVTRGFYLNATARLREWCVGGGGGGKFTADLLSGVYMRGYSCVTLLTVQLQQQHVYIFCNVMIYVG